MFQITQLLITTNKIIRVNKINNIINNLTTKDILLNKINNNIIKDIHQLITIMDFKIKDIHLIKINKDTQIHNTNNRDHFKIIQIIKIRVIKINKVFSIKILIQINKVFNIKTLIPINKTKDSITINNSTTSNNLTQIYLMYRILTQLNKIKL